MADPMHDTDTGADGTPRWVKVQAVFLVLLILLVIAMPAGLMSPALFGLDGGGHGPGGHSAPEGGHG